MRMISRGSGHLLREGERKQNHTYKTKNLFKMKKPRNWSANTETHQLRLPTVLRNPHQAKKDDGVTDDQQITKASFPPPAHLSQTTRGTWQVIGSS
jgi:hypothetical protein